MKKWITWIALLMIMMLVACSDDQEEQTNQKESIIPVEVVEVSEGELVVEREVYGRTQPSQTTPVIVQNPGEIDELNVENGDRVEEDDIIAKIKSPVGIQNVRAPEDGEIAQLDVEEGQLISDEEPLALIIDLDKVVIHFTVTGDVRSLFKKDDKVTAMFDDESFEGTITSIGKIPDETGLYPIEANVTNKDDYILPGMTGMIQVPEKRVKEALILPTEAVIEESDETFVYVLTDDHVKKTNITIIETQSDETAVEGELDIGDEVVINGQLTLSDGSKVDVVKEENES